MKHDRGLCGCVPLALLPEDYVQTFSFCELAMLCASVASCQPPKLSAELFSSPPTYYRCTCTSAAVLAQDAQARQRPRQRSLGSCGLPFRRQCCDGVACRAGPACRSSTSRKRRSAMPSSNLHSLRMESAPGAAQGPRLYPRHLQDADEDP